ncbi:6725_t:CDS:2 [Funneliformis geosporum]|uniref:17486_t:CDS:1 n=1 Tax=Funneliformis geosporum TaxID=1117311 RepID=A0A9W4SIF8_9GLOM|nr:17486_t:CDS:2 [Funneliformis geosporum]CAI2173374.1 6725_t:CDS:2 [Funneliformis geosporum]
MDDNLSLVNLTLTEQNITPLAVTATPEDLLELLEKFQEAKPIINYTLPVNFKKGQEVANQKQYYNNATATLIANDEGLLSKQTIFMFDDYLVDDSIKLSLSQALDAVKHRQQTVPLDGLYSILGLLPYGEQATVSYENNTLQQALQELMDLAIKENPSEAIS